MEALGQRQGIWQTFRIPGNVCWKYSVCMIILMPYLRLEVMKMLLEGSRTVTIYGSIPYMDCYHIWLYTKLSTFTHDS